ncbi:MAG: hypothetical protein Q9187_006839 [Circinaria calcarea]
MVTQRLAMADVDSYHLPHRKPIGLGNSYGAIQPLTKIIPGPQLPTIGQREPYHNHSRSVSSSVFPMATTVTPSPSSYHHTVNANRRTPSTSSSNTGLTNSSLIPSRTHSSSSSSIRRSTSSRSGSSITPSSYVALMRKQKATVWCDRAQHEDPRLLAQQKAAKMRATIEVEGGNLQGRISTSGSMGSGSLGVRSKIRHHGAPKAIGYSSGNLVGGGVPMRLSASEVGDDGNDDDDADSSRNTYTQRNGSGRSSLVSNPRRGSYGQNRSSGLLSQGSTSPSVQGISPGTILTDPAETPVPGSHQKRATGDYFQQPSGSGGSGSSSERESSFGNVGEMNAPLASSALRGDGGKQAEDLARRGSVDERAATMRGAVRLFVANPDLSD